jgi:hypothetical protein
VVNADLMASETDLLELPTTSVFTVVHHRMLPSESPCGAEMRVIRSSKDWLPDVQRLSMGLSRFCCMNH